VEERRCKPRINASSANAKIQHWRPALVVGMLLLLPVLTGIAAARRWPSIDESFYAVASQIIATLFIAISVEFFARDKLVWEDKLDQFMILALIAFSWSGLFACIRAMLDGGTALTSGLATAGLMSASVLVSLALFARVKASSSGSPARIVLMFLFPPVLLLILL
jgi:hypothetical protein